jgi:hypothetical protein
VKTGEIERTRWKARGGRVERRVTWFVIERRVP